MTGRNSGKRTSPCLLALMVYFYLAASDVFVAGAPEPLPPAMIYGNGFSEDAENLMLLTKMKQLADRKQEIIEQEREIAEEQYAIEAIFTAKAKEERMQQPDFSAEEPEALPIPSAIVHQSPQHSWKRSGGAYVSLCHFKICNMGRKRQL